MYTGRYLLDTRFRILGTVVNNKHEFVLAIGAFSVISADEGRSGRDDWAIHIDHQENCGASLRRSQHIDLYIHDHRFRVSRNCRGNMLDRRTTLCLACSSSLPPNVDDPELFITKCCQRPICPRCLETNPRLARYNPCLVCLAGVGVIQASSSARNLSGGKGAGGTGVQSVRVQNLDGGVKDQDLFVLADDDEDDEDEDASTDGEDDGRARRSAAPPPPDVVPKVSHLPETPPPPPVTSRTEDLLFSNPTPTPPIPDHSERHSTEPDSPVVYRLRRGDTLTGIALRFRLDVRPFPCIMSYVFHLHSI